MQGPIRCVVVAGLLIGCSDGPPVTPDADAPTGAGGLVVEWSSTPESWPGDIGNGITLERATFAFDSLRVVGDAGPGDPRTTASGFEIRWDEGSEPSDISFVDAPSGLYSQISLLIDGHLATESFELRGRADVGGTEYDYRIEGNNPLMFTVQIERTLTPPATATVRLRIDFQAALAAIEFQNLDIEDGRLELDDGDIEMAVFRTKLVESFQIVDGDGPAGGGAL